MNKYHELLLISSLCGLFINYSIVYICEKLTIKELIGRVGGDAVLGANIMFGACLLLELKNHVIS